MLDSSVFTLILVFIKDVFTYSLLYRGTPEFELIVLTANVSVGSSPDFCIALFTGHQVQIMFC